MEKGEGPVVETRDLTRGEGMSEEQATRPRVAKRGDFCVPPPDDTVPAPKPGGAGYRFVKRLFDIVFSAVVCAVLALPVAVLCLFVVLDSPGAPFFRQERIGLNGKKIRHLEDPHHGDGRAYKPPALYDSRAVGAVGARAEGR